MKNDVFTLAKCWISALILLSTALIARAQPIIEWNKTYGWSESNEFARSICQTSDGGYIVVGVKEWTTKYGPLTSDIYILKLDSRGNIEWERTYGGRGYDEAYSVQQTADGGYIVAGSMQVFEGYKLKGSEIYVLKLNSDGSIEWEKTYGGIAAYSVRQTSDGGYVVAGVTRSSKGDRDICVLKLDSNGNVVWNKTYGGSGNDVATSIQQTADGGYIIAGATRSVKKGGIYVLKLDPNGNIEWDRTYGKSKYDIASSIQQTNDGGYIVAGIIDSLENRNDIYILKLDSNGNVQWSRTYGGSDVDGIYSIQQTKDGGYIAVGMVDLFGKRKGDIYILKLDSNGYIQWEITHGGNDSDAAFSVQQISDGGYIVAGGTRSFGSGGGDVYVLKLSKEQTQISTITPTQILPTPQKLEKLHVSIQPKYVEAKAGDVINYTITLDWYPPEWRGKMTISAVISAAGFEKRFELQSVTPSSNPPITNQISIPIPEEAPPLTYKARIEVMADSLKVSDETTLKITSGTPGFEVVLAIAGLLVTTYLLKRN